MPRAPATPFRATVPLPPSANDAVRPARVKILVRGRAKEVLRLVKTKEAKEFKKACRELLARLVRSKALHTGPLEFYLTVYVPSLSSDGGNRVKLLEDAMKEIVIDDDRQFVEWHVVKRIDPERPRGELVVKPADPAEHAEVAARLARAERKAARGGRAPAAAPRSGPPRAAPAVERSPGRGGRAARRAGGSRPGFRIQPTPAVHRPR